MYWVVEKGERTFIVQATEKDLISKVEELKADRYRTLMIHTELKMPLNLDAKIVKQYLREEYEELLEYYAQYSDYYAKNKKFMQ